MSILKALQDWLGQYPHMELVVMTDQTTGKPSSYAVAPTGNGNIRRDITGTSEYQNSYLFLAKECATDELDRQDNHDLLERLSDWMEEQSEAGVLPALPGRFVAESIVASNGMLVDIDQDGLGLYQIQIQMNLSKRSEL